MFKSDRTSKDFWTGAVLGGALGAISALMFTGKGKKLQKEWLEKYKLLEGNAEHLAKKVLKKAKKVASEKKIKRVAKRAVKKTHRKIKQRKQTASKTLEQGY